MIVKKEVRRYGMSDETIANGPSTSMTRHGDCVRFLVDKLTIEITAEEIRRLTLVLEAGK